VQSEKEIVGISCPKAHRKGFDTCESVSFDIFEIIDGRIDKELDSKEGENQDYRERAATGAACKPCDENSPGETYNKVFNSKPPLSFKANFPILIPLL